MQIAVGCDHAGVELKEQIIKMLQAGGYGLTDFGTSGPESVDYPDYAVLVADAISAGKADLGVLICGTGIGISMAANKRHGIRAALCHNEFTAQMARAHNDANLLCMGARVIGRDLALATLKRFLETEFEAGRHQRRVDKIHAAEE